MAYLVIAVHGKEPCRQKIPAPSVTLGRAMGCEIWIDDRKLSRQHCRIERVGNDWFIEDLKSTNGTWMQGRQIERAKLRDGESFEAGDSRFVFHAGDYIANRPRDPLEAARLKLMTSSSDPAQETIVGHPLKLNGRAAPVPKPRVE
jgi:pSer/pThr/pTyr-binding forkhead associated (FHA) protein